MDSWSRGNPNSKWTQKTASTVGRGPEIQTAGKLVEAGFGDLYPWATCTGLRFSVKKVGGCGIGIGSRKDANRERRKCLTLADAGADENDLGVQGDRVEG